MKFLHLSDLHIGKRLNGMELILDQQHILRQALAMAQNCDALLLAGDLYDKAQPSSESIRIVSDFLVELGRLHKPVYIVGGNHDSAEQIAYCRELLDECGIYLSPPFNGSLTHHLLHDEHGEIHIWLLPFIKPANVRPFDSSVDSYDSAVRAILDAAEINPAVRNVLVAHQYVAGASTCESETRIIGGLDQVGADAFADFDYVALGHLHSPQRMLNGRVCYCGSPLKYSLSEEHQRKAALMTILGPKGELSTQTYPFEPLYDLRTVRGPLRDIASPERHSEDYVYAILTDEEPLVDPLGALRLTYPRLIGMRAQHRLTGGEEFPIEPDFVETLSPMEHFIAFYEAQNHPQKPDERRLSLMRTLIQEAEERQHASD